MTERDPNADFFVGYGNWVYGRRALFLLCVAAAGIAGMAGLSFAIGSRSNDPGGAYYATNLGKQVLTGVIDEKPYPILRVRPKAGESARAIVLMAPGKRGVAKDAAKLSRQLVQATGFFFRRGTIDVLQVSGKKGLVAHEAAEGEAAIGFEPAPTESLGRWRLTGEICDGKCYFGAMRPGTGIAHKACANLCITSGAAPVFVTTSPVEGNSFLVMADRKGEPLPDAFRDYVATLVKLEGEVERRDDLLIFKVDVTEAEVL